MQDQDASVTALGVAYIRAAHQLIDPRPLLFEDPIALPLLGPEAEARIRDSRPRYDHPVGRGLRSHVCLRSRFAEDRLAQAQADTYILVGAGFDTFAWRQPDWAKSLRILEIDHPATQAKKRAMLAAAGLAIPANLTLLAADFTRETLGDVLARQTIPAGARVYFSWLGVTMYLDEAAIDTSLAAMAQCGAYAALTLTFKVPEQSPADAQISAMVAAVGEAFVSTFSPAEIDAKLAAHGFGHRELLTPEAARQTYFTPPGSLPPPRRPAIVYAATACGLERGTGCTHKFGGLD
jgi:methyltransferase (TIGR00027 family)